MHPSAPTIPLYDRRVKEFPTRALIVLMSLSLLGAAPLVRDFDLAIAKRRLEGGPSTIRVKQGETVVLRWRSDEPVRLHLHGYDLHADVSPSAPATIRFAATAAGRFPVAAHRSGARETTLVYIEVLPQ